MNREKNTSPPSITLLLQPEGKELALPRPKTVLQLLGRLGIRRGTALVIRNGALLTPDRAILPGDHITVRVVTSSG
jgi:sulfur carrier protein